jgi:hypothetical protein
MAQKLSAGTWAIDGGGTMVGDKVTITLAPEAQTKG